MAAKMVLAKEKKIQKLLNLKHGTSMEELFESPVAVLGPLLDGVTVDHTGAMHACF